MPISSGDSTPSFDQDKMIDETLGLLKDQKPRTQTTKTVVIAMFDLSNSTKIKQNEGHSKGVQMALEHNEICEEIASRFGGHTIKHMGDGIFIEFGSALKACESALLIKRATTKYGRFQTKGGLTLGEVETLKVGNNEDRIGIAVDRCARLVSMAMPNQVLIDQALLDSTASFLKDREVLISEPFPVIAKGLGNLFVYELSTKSDGLTGLGIPSLRIIEEGRMPLEEKMAFISSAKRNIIEVGIGLTSFSNYFYRVRSSEFKDRLVSLLRKGTIINCLILDPESDFAKLYAKDNKERDYLQRIEESLKKLLKIKEELLTHELDNFRILKYNTLPRFQATCVDIDEPYGKLSISHYLPETLRSENPVTQFSKYSNPKLFQKYRLVINNLLNRASEVN